MGLSVGGIHVRTRDHEGVITAIKKHWLGVGAHEMPAPEDPLLLEPLSVEKTGKLGYAVWPATTDPDDTMWVAVYDSERYHGSDELARYLAKELDALVVIYTFVSSVDEAAMSVYRGASKQASWYKASDDWGEIESAITTLPFGLTYYNQLRGHSLDELGDPKVIGFVDMPFRKTGYRGRAARSSRLRAGSAMPSARSSRATSTRFAPPTIAIPSSATSC